MVYPCDYPPFRYNVLVAIYQADGSVIVSHGGIECGQGINTKVRHILRMKPPPPSPRIRYLPALKQLVRIPTQMMQVVAREFDIPLSSISVRSTNTLTNANGSVTGGSITSELNCYVSHSFYLNGSGGVSRYSCCFCLTGCYQGVHCAEGTDASFQREDARC